MLARSSKLRDFTGQMPPAKIGVWGDTMMKDDNNSTWDVLGRWFGVTRESKDNFAQPIYEDFMQYNDPKFFPPAIKPELDGTKLNSAQYDRLQILIGQQRKNLAKPFVNDGAMLTGLNQGYSELDKDDKLKALEYLYEVGRENGIELFRSEFPEFKRQPNTPTYESIMQKLDDRRFQLFKKSLPKIQQ